MADVCLSDPWVGQPCVRHYFQLTRLLKLVWRCMKFIYLPCSLCNLAAYWACKFSSVCNYVKRTRSLKSNTYLSSHLSWEPLYFHLIKFNIRCATAQQKKILTCTNILLDALLFGLFCFGNRYSGRFLLGCRLCL